MTWKDEIKKYEGPESERYRTLNSAYNPDPDEEDRYEEYRESESLYDEFYKYVEELNSLVDDMKPSTKSGDLISKEVMEKVLNQLFSVLDTIKDYY